MKKGVGIFIYLLIALFLFGFGVNKVYAANTLAFEKSEFTFDKYMDSIILNMTIPDGYAKKDLHFESTDTSVAKVQNFAEQFNLDDSYDIILESRKQGTATITVRINNTDYEATCKVKVLSPIKTTFKSQSNKVIVTVQNKHALTVSIPENKDAVEIKVKDLDTNKEGNWIRLGSSLNDTYTYTIGKEGNYKVTVRWISYDQSTPDNITTIITNEATYTSTVHTNTNTTSTTNNTVEATNNTIKIVSADDNNNITVGQELSLSIEFNGLEQSEVVWTSSNPEIATVDQTGKVTGLAEGSTTIKASVNDTYIDEYTVVINKAEEVVTTTGNTAQENTNNPYMNILMLALGIVVGVLLTVGFKFIFKPKKA